MSLPRHAARRDLAEPEVIEALEALGFTVRQLSGRNLPDLLAARRGVNYLIEVKTGRAKLRPGQAAFRDTWRGPVAVLRSRDDALAWARQL